MGRPAEKTDRDGLENYHHTRNAVCSRNFLDALKAAHQCAAPAAVENVILPPISNKAIARASDFAFPMWVSAIKRIQHAVCIEFGITISELLSQRRNVRVVRPRQVGMYLCKILTDRSYPEIGRRFGGRDHTTVITAVRRTEELCASDEILKARVITLQESLGGQFA